MIPRPLLLCIMKRYKTDMEIYSLEELSIMTSDKIINILEERKKFSPIDIDAQRERHMQRLAEESMVLRREIQLKYQDLMLSYDI